MAILRLLLRAAIFAGLKRFYDMPMCFVVQLELGLALCIRLQRVLCLALAFVTRKHKQHRIARIHRMRRIRLRIPDLLRVPMVPALLSRPPVLPLARTDLFPLTRHLSNAYPASERKCRIARPAHTRRLTPTRRTAVCSVVHAPYPPSLPTRLPPRTHLKYNYAR
ncbi:hypothetical protein DFH08DRAFT_983536 [Mycena albidolilacea]|uniref:Uncharacterized protein n=1 Tax=Mycena albidolilacea TaxID=1033008 RepID=A0AAD7AWF0_9AGAR|nr:hypothetical protein DFH08DRAFT_983536 [Mycena albidolilacea]